MDPAKKIWMDGRLVDWDDAQVHVLTHTLHYGLGVFEGIRCYATPEGPAVFRLQDHVRRLLDSCRIARLDLKYSQADIEQAILATIAANGRDACYIRPLVFLGYGKMGINSRGVPVRICIATWGWGAYLGEDGLEKGIRACVSSFTRHHPNVSMTKAKICGNYANSQLAKLEALENGYDEALLLDPQGYVAEGSGENVFIVRNGVLKTPTLAHVLAGITRDSVIELARDMGLTVAEEQITRDEFYVADEAFFTGTAAEVTPIREIDRRVIGAGRRGALTQRLQEAFYQATEGKLPQFRNWLTFLKVPSRRSAASQVK